MHLDPPTFTTAEVYAASVSGIQDTSLRAIWQAREQVFSSASLVFELAARAELLYTLDSSAFKVSDVEADVAVKEVYTNGLARRKDGRRFYDKIMAISTNDQCPLCGFGQVKTLEHHLPKQLFPALCVTVKNIFPVCTDCNFSKNDSIPQSYQDQTLHPYFDDLSGQRWLYASVEKSMPASVEFYVKPPGAWTADFANRVRGHFSAFGLSRRFSIQANRMIAGQRVWLQGLHDKTGKVGVSDTLREMAESYMDVNLNKLEGVVLESLSMSSWYCAGGFSGVSYGMSPPDSRIP